MSQEPDKLREILDKTQRIAVIGMKRFGAARSVPLYMERAGYEIVAVNPTIDEIDGRPVVDTVTDIEGPVDMVNVFRRSDAVAGHVDEILAMEPLPTSVWLQLGIRSDEAAKRLEEAGIDVVQDRCIKVEHASRMR